MGDDGSTSTARLAPSAIGTVATGLRRVIARFGRAGRRGAEALLHPYRRRKALGLATASRTSPRIVVICLGNICRSPYAAASLRRILAGRGMQREIVSAGLIGPGRRVPDEAIAAAGSLGHELGDHESRLVSPDLLRPGDLAVVMASSMAVEVSNRVGFATGILVLGDLDPRRWEGRTIADPWGGPAEAFTSSFARIDRCLEVLVAEWKSP